MKLACSFPGVVLFAQSPPVSAEGVGRVVTYGRGPLGWRGGGGLGVKVPTINENNGTTLSWTWANI